MGIIIKNAIVTIIVLHNIPNRGYSENTGSLEIFLYLTTDLAVITKSIEEYSFIANINKMSILSSIPIKAPALGMSCFMPFDVVSCG